jgi:hypothetical protein
MGLFSCCRSDQAVNEEAHAKGVTDADQAASQGDFDEDLEAVQWLRARSLELSYLQSVPKDEEDELKITPPAFTQSIPDDDQAKVFPEIQLSLSDPKTRTPPVKKTDDNIGILEELLKESQQSHQEIRLLQQEAQDSLRVLSQSEQAEREERQEQKLDKRRKREERRKSEQQERHPQEQQPKQSEPSPDKKSRKLDTAMPVSPAIQAATESLEWSPWPPNNEVKAATPLIDTNENTQKKSKSAGTASLELEPGLEVDFDFDALARDRYLSAVQLLHRRIIQKEQSLSPAEMKFLQDLLQQKDDDESTIDDRISEIELTMERMDSNHRLGANPLSMAPFDSQLDSDPAFMPSDDRDSGASIDVYSETSSASEMGVEVTLDVRGSSSTKKKASKREITRQSSPPLLHEGLPTIFAEDDVDDDDLQDSPYPILGAGSLRSRLVKVRLMEALRGFLPYAVSEQNFWLKFSLELDGCSLKTLLHKMRGSESCLLVIQAKGDEERIFGSFTSSPWRRHESWYGSGQSFLFKKTDKLEVYPFIGADDMVQYSSAQFLAVGGGDWTVGSPFSEHEKKGIGLLVDGDLQGGESYSSATFCNPALSRQNEFSILNIEVWTLTPCMTELEAEKLEKHKAFVEANLRESR